MTLPTIQSLKDEADLLGLTGDSVAKYCLDQQAIARDERAKERALIKLQTEAAEAAKIREHESSEADKIRAHELAMAQVAASNNNSNNNTSVPPVLVSDSPKLPIFKESEDITSYLIRFERIASLLNVDPDTYAARLGSLLTGKAVDIYASLPPEITNNYDRLKSSLLLAFRKTPDVYRSEFKNASPTVNESYEQFVTQLGRKLDYWIDSNHIEKDYESLREFILKDQLLASVPADLRLYLKEHGTLPLDEVVILADNWVSAHRSRLNKIPKVKPQKPTDSKQTDSHNYGNRRPVKCFSCGASGHIKRNCPKNPAIIDKPSKDSFHKVNVCWEDNQPREYLSTGTVNGSRVSTIYRDTGCSTVVVANEVLPNIDLSQCPVTQVSDYLGNVNSFPVVRCYLKCDFYEGFVNAIRAPIKFCSVLLGNIPGVKNVNPTISDESETNNILAVATRSSSRNITHPLIVPEIEPLDITPSEFSVLQNSCTDLADIRSKLTSNEIIKSRNGTTHQFKVINNLIYRVCLESKAKAQVAKKALVVPLSCRKLVLKLAHESLLAGHFSHRKTESRIAEIFYWPRMGTDVRNYCRSCDKCQRMSHKGRTKPVPLVKMPVFTEPFSRVSMDIIGPLFPATSEGHKYVLTLIDFSTGFPEALPLKNIDSISVAEALLQIFSRVGIPREILSDRGTQFTSLLMAELHRLLGVKPLFTTPFHPQGNGRIERLHSTLKSILRKVCADRPKEWHRYLIPTLFALREIPSDRSGFSAFELLYGKQVRGPLAVLRDLWEDSKLEFENRPTFQYIFDLREKLEDCAEVAVSNSEISSNKFKTYFDLKSQSRSFKVGDEVLVLLPDNSNKLLMSWSGPHKVIQRKNKVDYVIDKNGYHKTYHINLLKKYFRRATANLAAMVDERPPESLDFNVVQFVIEELAEEDSPPIHLPVATDEQPDVCQTLSKSQNEDLKEILISYDDVLSNKPGHTNTVVHDIKLITTSPTRSKVYPVPVHLREHFEREVDNLLELGIIQPSNSAYCSPVVLVKKGDGYRLTVDYRHLNSITVFDAEPSCNLEDDLHKFTGSEYFSELDLTKAYHQISMTKHAQELSAFPTHRGLMQYSRLPFGMVTACATYIRLMRIVLAGLPNVSFYFDNIFVYNQSWSDHVSTLRSVFDRLRAHGLTAQPAKCRFGFPSLNYLGFVVDKLNITPQQSKVSAILNAPLPTSKKALRSYLGMVSFYRRFIPNLSSLTGPLSDLPRKEIREPRAWNDKLRENFFI